MDEENLEAEESGELPDSDHDNIYDDIADFDLGKEVDKLKAENSMLKDHINSLQEDIEKLTKAIVTLKKVQQNLEKNISSLYLTAKGELDRKNRQIADLQRELDDIKFRRKRPAADNQFNPHKRAKFENKQEQTIHTNIDSQFDNNDVRKDSMQKMPTRNKEINGPQTQFNWRKQEEYEENRGYREETYEGLSNNHNRVRYNDQASDKHDTPDSRDRKGDLDTIRDRELEHRLGKDRDANRQVKKWKQDYEDTRCYREDRYDGLGNQKKIKYSDQAGDRHDTPDSEERKSDVETSRVRESENRLGKDRERRQFGRSRKEENDETRGYRNIRYEEFSNERRERNSHDHSKNRVSWGYHMERDMHGDRGYREGRGGVRDRVSARDRNFAHSRDSSRERPSSHERDREGSRDKVSRRPSSHERDREGSRDKVSRSGRNTSRERRHTMRDDPKDGTFNKEMKPKVMDKQPEKTEVEKDHSSYVQVSKLVARKKLKVVQKLEESMNKSSSKRNTSLDNMIGGDAQSKMITSDEKDLAQTQSTTDKKIRVLSNIILSDGSGQNGELTQSSTPEKPFGIKDFIEAANSDDLTQIKKFLDAEGLSFRNKTKNSDYDSKKKGDLVKKISLDAYKDRNQNLNCEKKNAKEDTEIRNEPESLRTKEQLKNDLEAEGLIFQNEHSTAVVKKSIEDTQLITESICTNEAIMHMGIKTGTKADINEKSEATEDLNRKEASAGLLLLLGMEESIKPAAEHLISGGKMNNWNVENKILETGKGQSDVIGENEVLSESTMKDTMTIEKKCPRRENHSNSAGCNTSKEHSAVTENQEADKSQKKTDIRKTNEKHILADNNKYKAIKEGYSSENTRKGSSKVQLEKRANVIDASDGRRKKHIEEKEIGLNIGIKSREENMSVENNSATRGIRTSPRKKNTGKQSSSSDLREKMKSLFDESMDGSEPRSENKSTQNIGFDKKCTTIAHQTITDIETDFQFDMEQNIDQEMKDGKFKTHNSDSNSGQKSSSDLENNKNNKVTSLSGIKRDNFKHQEIVVVEKKETAKLRSSPRKTSLADQDLSRYPQKSLRGKSSSRKSVSEQETKKQKTKETDIVEKSNSRQNNENKTLYDETLKASFDKLNRQIDAVAAGVCENQKVNEAVTEKVMLSKNEPVEQTKQKDSRDVSSVKYSTENYETKISQKVSSSVNHPNKRMSEKVVTETNPPLIVTEEKSNVADSQPSLSCLNDTSTKTSSTILTEAPPSVTPENKKNVPRKRITPTPVTDTLKPASFGDMLKKCETPLAGKSSKNLVIEQNLHLTHEGDIPLLHIEESHIDSLPIEDLRNPDSSLMRLIDTMTLSNMECELPKAQNVSQCKKQGNDVNTPTTELSFENLMYKVSSSPVHVTSVKGLGVNVSCDSNVVKDNVKDAICTNRCDATNASVAGVTAGITATLSSGRPSGVRRKRRYVDSCEAPVAAKATKKLVI